eukprot:6311536-Karenia_brevis.AAC.1
MQTFRYMYDVAFNQGAALNEPWRKYVHIHHKHPSALVRRIHGPRVFTVVKDVDDEKNLV